jgi:gluconate 2-dehydrogenase gamma chain
MLTKNSASRRRFLKSTGTLTGVSLLRIGAPALVAITEAACTAKQESSSFVVLSDADAADLAAIAARILPTTDTPGASEAGVIYFIDRALGAELAPRLPVLLAGLAELNAGPARVADLDAAAQDELLASIDGDAFFGELRTLTITGFFAMSAYGGNKDKVAWKLIGFEGDHGAWEYPFGHYDAEYAKERSNGE